MNKRGDSCTDYALIGKVIAGMIYTKVHGKFFGPSNVVLADRKNSEQKPLSLRLTTDFLEENNLGLRFGIDESYGQSVFTHFQTCVDGVCTDAKTRFNLAANAMRGGFPEGVILRCAFECGAASGSNWALGNSSGVYFHDKDGWKDSVDILETYFRWFDGENKKDWIWPIEVGWPRLYSERFISMNIDSHRGNVVLTPDGSSKKTVEPIIIPLDLVRKVSVISSYSIPDKTWYNPQDFHVDKLVDPENQHTINQSGNVIIQFRETLDGIIEKAKSFQSEELRLFLKPENNKKEL